ncbi:MAG: thrombospondin type 3 repeat-containing protein [Anaerolineae bacterium]|nr:thrombospondin type 3 repeat-containing protein [Anaerolineae bacterium]
MKRNLFVAVLITAALVLIGSQVLPLKAANVFSFSYNPSSQAHSTSWEPTQNDGDGYDWICVVCYDSAGDPTDVDTSYAVPGSGTRTYATQCDSMLSSNISVSAASGDPSSPRPTTDDNNALNVNWCVTAASDPDTDGDGVPDSSDICPGYDDHQDTDGDGTPDGCDNFDNRDSDGDGVPNGSDVCSGFDDHNDADNDSIPDGCDPDDDNDGVDDTVDQCHGSDDNVDVDGDGTPDGCDADDDGDGVDDVDDQCPGGDDRFDADSDGTPDDCDADDDNDGVDDTGDQCQGADDGRDMDGDGIPNGCDGYDNRDVDEDGVPDSEDICPDGDDNVDNDGDDIPNACDETPFPPGPDMVPIPDWAVVGTFTADTVLHFAPMPGALSDFSMTVGQTLWVFGMDDSGTYYQVLLSGLMYWVPVNQMYVTYDWVWNGEALPTTIVH